MRRDLLVVAGVLGSSWIAGACGSSSHGDDDSGVSHGGASARAGRGGAGAGDTSSGGAGTSGRSAGQSGGSGGTSSGGGSGGSSAASAGKSATSGRGGASAAGGGSDPAAGDGGTTESGPVAIPPPLAYVRESIGDSLNDVWGSGPDDVYAVGYEGVIAHGSARRGFTREHAGTTDTEIYSVWGSSRTDVFAGAAAGRVAHASGADSWTYRDVSGIAGPVYQSFGFAPDDMYLAAGVLWQGSLNSWKKVPDGPPANSIWGSSPTDLYTVATVSSGQPNVYHSKGDGQWDSQANTGEYMNRVSGFDATHVFAIGSHSVWFSRGDGHWASLLTLTNTQPSALAASDGLAYIGTQAGTLYVTNGDETSSPQTVDAARSGLEIRGVYAAASDDVYLATSSGLYHGTPTGMDPTGGEGGAPGAGGESGDGGGTFSTDPTQFYGQSRCDGSLAFCEDFESGTLDTSRWFAFGDVPVIDETQAARGTHALHIQTTSIAIAETWDLFPRPYDTFALRFFVRFGALPVNTNDLGPWALVRAESAATNLNYAQFGANFAGGVPVFQALSADPFIELPDTDSNPQLPLGQWQCVEWLNDGLTDEWRVFVDNVERPSMHMTPSLTSKIDGGSYKAPEFDLLELGWSSVTLSAPVELWIDEIAADSHRIGCER